MSGSVQVRPPKKSFSPHLEASTLEFRVHQSVYFIPYIFRLRSSHDKVSQPMKEQFSFNAAPTVSAKVANEADQVAFVSFQPAGSPTTVVCDLSVGQQPFCSRPKRFEKCASIEVPPLIGKQSYGDAEKSMIKFTFGLAQ